MIGSPARFGETDSVREVLDPARPRLEYWILVHRSPELKRLPGVPPSQAAETVPAGLGLMGGGSESGQRPSGPLCERTRLRCNGRLREHVLLG